MSEAATTVVKNKRATKTKTTTAVVDPKKRIESDIVDQIALIDTLDEVRKDLTGEVLALATQEGAKYVDGTLASGTINVSNPGSEINAEKFYGLIKKKKLTIKQFLACISVGVTEAKKAVGEELLKGISTVKPAKAPSVTIKQKADAAPPQLLDVLQQLEPVVKKFKQKRADASSAQSDPQAPVTTTDNNEPGQPAGLQ